MEPIFDAAGETVGWLHADIVCGFDGTATAFLLDGNIFNYEGRHLGQLDRGFFRDTAGDAVAFLSVATGGPLTPPTQVPSVAPVLQPPPPPAPLPEVAPPPPPSLDWSNLEWDEFLAGTE